MDLSILKWDDMWSWNRAIEGFDRKNISDSGLSCGPFHISPPNEGSWRWKPFWFDIMFPIFPPFFQFFRSMTLAEPKSYSLRRAWDPTAPLEELKKLLEEDWEVPLESVGLFFPFPISTLVGILVDQKSVLVLKGEEGEVWRMKSFFIWKLLKIFGLGERCLQKNPKGGMFSYRRKRPTPTPKIWKFGRAFALTWKTPKELKWKRQKAMMLMQMKLFLKPKAHHLGVVGTHLPPTAQQIWGGAVSSLELP